MANGSDVLDERRVASATVRGYEYQVLRAALIWLDLEDGETLLCEGDEDNDRILRDGTRLSEQDKHYQGTLRLKDRAVADSLIAFARTWVARHDGKGSSRFRFVTTADRPKPLDEEGWRALVRRDLPALVMKREAGLAGQVEDCGGWDVFCLSVDWCFGDGKVELKRGELVAAVGRRVPGSPSTLFAARLVAHLLAATGNDEPTLRKRTRADLDALARVTDEELRSWVRSGDGSAIAERFELAGLLDDGLRPLSPEKEKTPSSLLVAGARIVEFNREIRAVEWRMFEALLASDQQVLILLIYGEGGSGKTRFAIEAVQEARQRGWIAGFLRARPDDDSWRRLRKGRLPRLVVLDYAESRDEELKRLLELADMIRKDGGPPLRLLLLAREKAEWWTNLAERGESVFQNLLVTSAATQRISPITLDAGQRELLFATAREQLAAQIDSVDPVGTERPSLASPAFARPLYVVCAAYAALRGVVVEDEVAVLSWVLNHEALFWKKGLEARGWKSARAADWTSADANRIGKVARAVAAFALLGGVSERDGAEAVVMAAISDIGSEEWESVTGLLCDVYGADEGSRIVAALEPDLLGERLVELVLAADGELLERLCDHVLESDGRVERCLEVLGRIGVRNRQATRWIETVLGFDVARTAGLAISVALTLGAHSASAPVGDCLAAVLARSGTASISNKGLEQLEQQFPRSSVSLARVAGWVAEQLLNQPDAQEDSPQHAHRLRVFAQRASDFGRRQDAESAAAKAVRICRTLEIDATPSFRPDLADSLRIHSHMLIALGGAGAARAKPAVMEATQLYSVLAAHDRAKFLPLLAESLSQLGVVHRAGLEIHEAIAAIEKSVRIRRALAESNSDECLSRLAESLSNLGLLYKTGSRHQEAGEKLEEAVSIGRGLANRVPDEFLPHLATSLTNLANLYLEIDQFEKSEIVAEEAVVIFRALAKQHSERFGRLLSGALNTLALVLRAFGRHERAVQLLVEALTSVQADVVALPATFAPMARGIVDNYLRSVKDAGQEPQLDLLRPITQAIGEAD